MQIVNANKRALKKWISVVSLILILSVLSLLVVGCGSKSHTPTPSGTGGSDEGAVFETYGKITEYSTYAKGEILYDSFYYSDGWFGQAPEERNDRLALLSMQLAAAAITDEPNGYGATALRALGFETVGFVGFGTEDPDDCAYTWGKKTVAGRELVVIVVQSYALDAPTKVEAWKQNFSVNGEEASDEHAAFRLAAEKVLDGIASLGGKDAKYWITGQSRAGAIADLIAAKLPDKIGAAEGRIYAYTFESPCTTDAASLGADAKKYDYIHNYVTDDDIVTMIPMWGMTRYGQEHQLKTDATEIALSAELAKIGSSAAEVEAVSARERVIALASYLERRVSVGTGSAAGSRGDYSLLRRDIFTDGGQEVTVEYSYQETMVHLMEAIFSGRFNDLSYELIDEHLQDFYLFVCGLAEGVKKEGTADAAFVSSRYWQAAKGIHAVLDGLVEDGSIGLSDIDFYALLRLIGPMAVDADYEPEDEEGTSAVFGYLSPLFDLVQSFSGMQYSHHFDAVIARLKTLAPHPAAPSFDISLTEPKAGDSVDAAARSFRAAIQEKGYTWFSVLSAGWEGEDLSLLDGSLYYFRAEAEVVGHLVPEGFRILLGGKEPIGCRFTDEKGVTIVELTWEFVVGTPAKVAVRFDSGKEAAAPESILVDRGKKLAFVERPHYLEKLTEKGASYLFDDWQDANGALWEEITVKEEITLTASWIFVIEEVDLRFLLPKIGEEVVIVPSSEGAHYYVSEFNVCDEEYHFFETITAPGHYEVNVFIKNDEKAVFATEIGEFDELEYVGSIHVNGEEPSDYIYDGYEGVATLIVSFSFDLTE